MGARPDRVRRELRALGATSVVVKVRGNAGNADQWTRDLARSIDRRRRIDDDAAPGGRPERGVVEEMDISGDSHGTNWSAKLTLRAIETEK